MSAATHLNFPCFRLHGRTTRLAPLIMLAVLVAGTLASAKVWAGCALEHGLNFGHLGRLEIACVAAGLAAVAVAAATLWCGVRYWRRGAPARVLWLLAAVVLAIGFGGTSLQQASLEVAEAGTATVVDEAIGDLSATFSYGLGAVAGLGLAGVLARAMRRTMRGARLGGLEWTGIASFLGVITAWSAHTVATGTPIGTASVEWTLDPTIPAAVMLTTGILFSFGRRYARRPSRI